VLSLRRNRYATYNLDDLITKSETVFHDPRRQIDDGTPRVHVDGATGAAPFETAFPEG
jgi:hypothetical protein